MKIMIIDDEKNIREGLHYSIPWEKIDIDEVRDYASAEEALSDFSSFMPDIVISDIRMDGMSGLEFFENAKKINSDFQIIFISGYADFEYVVKAMRLGATDYELKPINNEKLMKLVDRVRLQIANHTKQKDLMKEMEKSNRAKKTFDVLCAEVSKEELALYFRSVYDLDTRKRVILSVLEIDKIVECDKKCIEQHLDQIQKNLREKLQIVFWEKLENVCAFSVEVNASYIYAFNVQYFIKRSVEFANHTKENDLIISASISNVLRIEEIGWAYRQLKRKLKEQFYDGPGTIYIEDKSNIDPEIEKDFRISDFKKEFIQTFNEKDIYKLKSMIDCLGEHWKSTKQFSEYEIKKEISNIMKELMFKQIAENQLVIIDIIQFNEQINGQQYLDGVLELWKQSIQEYYHMCEERSNNSYSKNINKALEYISDNYRKQISVEMVSEHISKTPNYFSTLFKKEIGMSFSEYVNILRIKKAKELMDNSDMLLNEIAEYVGYSNYIYFTQVFKKIEGFSPSKNRNKNKHKS